MDLLPIEEAATLGTSDRCDPKEWESVQNTWPHITLLDPN